MQYRPNEIVGISHLITDPLDVGLYYVRAVLRDSRTNATIRSVDLTRDSSNTRRFYGEIQMPDVQQSQSRSVDITTTVYTDSGYTTQSEEHQEVSNMYIVAERWNEAMGFGGGGGISRKDVREVVTEILSKVRAEDEKKANEKKTEDRPVKLPESVVELMKDTLVAVRSAEESLKNAVSESDSRENVKSAKEMLEKAAKSIPEEVKASMRMLMKDMQRSDRSEASEKVDSATKKMTEENKSLIEEMIKQFADVVKYLDILGKRLEKLEQKQWTFALTPLDSVKPMKEEKEEDPLPPLTEFLGRRTYKK